MRGPDPCPPARPPDVAAAAAAAGLASTPVRAQGGGWPTYASFIRAAWGGAVQAGLAPAPRARPCDFRPSRPALVRPGTVPSHGRAWAAFGGQPTCGGGQRGAPRPTRGGLPAMAPTAWRGCSPTTAPAARHGGARSLARRLAYSAVGAGAVVPSPHGPRGQ